MLLSKAILEFINKYTKTHDLAGKTIAGYTADLEQLRDFAGRGFDLESIDGALVKGWIEKLRSGRYSAASIRRKVATLKVFCTYWVRKGRMSESPFWRMELILTQPVSKKSILSKKEIHALLAQARHNNITAGMEKSGRRSQFIGPGQKLSRSFMALRDLALVELLCATGMRCGEAASLNIDDLHIRQWDISVSDPYGRTRLAVVMSEDAMSAIRAYLKDRKALRVNGNELFINSAGQRMSTQWINYTISRLARQAGIKAKVTTSVLRNSLEDFLLRKHVDIRVVMKQLGKSTPSNLEGERITKGHMIGELRKYQPALGLE